MDKKPTIVLEFWDDEDQLVIARFRPDGTTDAIVSGGTTSDRINEIRGRQSAQVSVEVMVSEPEEDNVSAVGLYRAVGMIEMRDDDNMTEMVREMLVEADAYDTLLEQIPDWAKQERVLQ